MGAIVLSQLRDIINYMKKVVLILVGFLLAQAALAEDLTPVKLAEPDSVTKVEDAQESVAPSKEISEASEEAVDADVAQAEAQDCACTEDCPDDVAVPLQAVVIFDWPDLTQAERDERIEEYRAAIFGPDPVSKYNKVACLEQYEDYLKDFDFKENLWTVRNQGSATEKANLCAFYWKEVLVSYAVQYKNDMRTVYYYNLKGTLQYVDVISEDYPNFPYTSVQYRANGKLVSGIYFASRDMQYMYEPNGDFQGIWYKENMYNRKGKKSLTRTNW